MTSEKCSLLSSYLFLLKKYPAFQLSHKLFDHCLLCYWNHPILKDWNASEKKAETLPLIFLPFSNKSPQGKKWLKKEPEQRISLTPKETPLGVRGRKRRSWGRGYLYFFLWCHHLESSKASEKEGNGCRVHTGQRDKRQLYQRYTSQAEHGDS